VCVRVFGVWVGGWVVGWVGGRVCMWDMRVRIRADRCCGQPKDVRVEREGGMGVGPT
jgi:hypothetical protein